MTTMPLPKQEAIDHSEAAQGPDDASQEAAARMREIAQTYAGVDFEAPGGKEMLEKALKEINEASSRYEGGLAGASTEAPTEQPSATPEGETVERPSHEETLLQIAPLETLANANDLLPYLDEHPEVQGALEQLGVNDLRDDIFYLTGTIEGSDEMRAKYQQEHADVYHYLEPMIAHSLAESARLSAFEETLEAAQTPDEIVAAISEAPEPSDATSIRRMYDDIRTRVRSMYGSFKSNSKEQTEVQPGSESDEVDEVAPEAEDAPIDAPTPVQEVPAATESDVEVLSEELVHERIAEAVDVVNEVADAYKQFLKGDRTMLMNDKVRAVREKLRATIDDLNRGGDEAKIALSELVLELRQKAGGAMGRQVPDALLQNTYGWMTEYTRKSTQELQQDVDALRAKQK